MSTQYIKFTQDQMRQAKQIDLAVFLKNRGEPIKRSGREYEWEGHHVTLRGNRWYDHYNQKGGTAIDFVCEYYKMAYPDAVQYLLGIEPSAIYRKEFELPVRNNNMRRVFAYLMKQRCIDRNTIYHFAHLNLLYEDAKYHNAVFVGRDQSGKARHAHKKSTSVYDGSYRGNQAGSDIDYSFHHIGKDDTIYAFEAPVDMLSFISMNPASWQSSSYVALCSVSGRALFYQLRTNPHIQKIILCLDNDTAGKEAAARITNELADMGYINVSTMLPESKDWNEELRKLRLKGEPE